MGYDTDFVGQFQIRAKWIALLNDLAYQRNNKYDDGTQKSFDALLEGFVPDPVRKRQNESQRQRHIKCSNVPEVWCKWRLEEGDGCTILRWSGAEKFYSYVEWLQYVLNIIQDNRLQQLHESTPQFDAPHDAASVLATLAAATPAELPAGVLKLVAAYRGADWVVTGRVTFQGELQHDYGYIRILEVRGRLSVALGNVAVFPAEHGGFERPQQTIEWLGGMFVLRPRDDAEAVMKETKEREAESKGQEKPDASAAAAKPAEEATDEEGNEEEEGDAEADVDTTKIVRTTPPLEAVFEPLADAITPQEPLQEISTDPFEVISAMARSIRMMGGPLDLDALRERKSTESDAKPQAQQQQKQQQQQAQAKAETGAQQSKSAGEAKREQHDGLPPRCCSACGVLFAGEAHNWLTLTSLSGPWLCARVCSAECWKAIQTPYTRTHPKDPRREAKNDQRGRHGRADQCVVM